MGLERGPLSLVSTTEELLERRSRGSGLESQEYGRRYPSHWPRSTLYPQKPGSNSADKPHSLGRYGSLADSGQGVRFVFGWVTLLLDHCHNNELIWYCVEPSSAIKSKLGRWQREDCIPYSAKPLYTWQSSWIKQRVRQHVFPSSARSVSDICNNTPAHSQTANHYADCCYSDIMSHLSLSRSASLSSFSSTAWRA
jgi:hypothetical protein